MDSPSARQAPFAVMRGSSTSRRHLALLTSAVLALSVGLAPAVQAAPMPVAATAAPAATPAAPAPAPGDADVALSFRVGGLARPVYMVSAKDDSGRLFIVQQGGKIRIYQNGALRSTPFLDITSTVSNGYEQGLLGLAFHPGFKTNRKLYVYFTDNGDDIVIREYKTKLSNKNVVDTSTARKIIEISHPYTNHNGGSVVFGPDGYLYFGTGDGGDSDDPAERAQNINSRLGKMLRIDVNGTTSTTNYRIPSSNPYLGIDGLNEIWQIGLRNPYRFSFDRANGNMWIGDVGQGTWEEIDRAIRTSSGAGRKVNWGWDVLEGTQCHEPSSGCSTSGKTGPLLQYGQSGGRCAVTGGYVYRGSAIPALVGGYVFADYCSGEIWVVDSTASPLAPKTLLLDTAHQISGFGENQAGELYVLNHGGAMYALVQG
jgi:glucose/arabinose dehydrogenase